MDRRTLEEIQDILRQIDELRQRLDQLLEQSELPGLTEPIRGTLEEIDGRARQQADQQFWAALARVNFEDRDYRLIRVIDGDTLEVRPPEELMRWMRDVHIRLYGVDAPESNTELGPIYTEILEKLCQLNDGRLHVVWERERRGTEYGGFPTSSFERGIANLFVDIGDGFFLYVNAILASLPDMQIERNMRALIRAARHLREWPHPLWRHWHRHWPFDRPWPWPPYPAQRMLDYLRSRESSDLRARLHPGGRYHPGFVWALPKPMVLRPPDGPDAMRAMLSEWREVCDCPICDEVAHEFVHRWPRLLEREDATPFDLLLLLAYAWGHEPEPETTE